MSSNGAFGRTSEPPERSSQHSSRLTREQLVDRIMTLNPTATPEFLARFEHESLDEYLRRLATAKGPRGRDSGWVRPPGASAVTSRAAGQ